jgi:uncharacterized protein (DUF433 family)
LRRLNVAHQLTYLLSRIEWDSNDCLKALYPVPPSELFSDNKDVIIDPSGCFGNPTIVGSKVPTFTIKEMYNSGHTLELISKLIKCSPEQIESAILFEST